MLEIILYICVFLLGFFTASFILCSASVGKIRIDESDTMDGPHFFLQIYDRSCLERIMKRKVVMLDVEKKDFISRD